MQVEYTSAPVSLSFLVTGQNTAPEERTCRESWYETGMQTPPPPGCRTWLHSNANYSDLSKSCRYVSLRVMSRAATWQDAVSQVYLLACVTQMFLENDGVWQQKSDVGDYARLRHFELWEVGGWQLLVCVAEPVVHHEAGQHTKLITDKMFLPSLVHEGCGFTDHWVVPSDHKL